MKNAILLLVFFTTCTCSITTYATTYYARTTGNWSGSVWSTSPTGTASTATIDVTDDVVVQDGVTITVNLESTTVASLTIGGGTSGKLQLDSYIYYNALLVPVQFTSLVIVTGDVIVNQGAILTTVDETGINISNIIVGGNLVVNGTLSTNTDPLSFTFNKNGVAIISGNGILSFNDITIGTNNNILLATDITHNGTITVSGGNLYVGYLKTLTLGAGIVVSSSNSVNVLGTINCNTNVISDATLNTGSFILVGTATVTPTGNTTFGSSSIASVSSITGVSIGMGITGLGIPTGTFVT
ncbi:MAG: hypothetical protein H7068_09275, partial [Pedobacter sp.]|nr:hypothetical protein [Chitinophagaceae bacterium]